MKSKPKGQSRGAAVRRVLVIPDIHYRLSMVNVILEREYDRATRIVFLGDYFDTQDHSHELTAVTALWLKGLLHDRKCVCLLGNHDLQYLYADNAHFRVKGFRPDTARVVSALLGPEDRKRFALFHFEGNWLMSHAGIHPGFLTHRHGSLRSQATVLAREAFAAAEEGQPHEFLEAGQARKGLAPYGGVTWLDFEDEFLPVTGAHQIVGHTRGSGVRSVHVPQSRNYCLDAQSRYYGILSGNQFQIKKWDTGKPVKTKDIKIIND